MESSFSRQGSNPPGMPCIGRWILNHWTTREIPSVRVIFIDLPLNLLILFSEVVDLLIRQSKTSIIFTAVFLISGISVYYSFSLLKSPIGSCIFAHYFHNILTKCMCMLSHLQLFVTPWPVAHQAPLFMEFSRQQYWSGLPFPPPGDLLHWQADSFQCATWEAL